MTSSGPRLVEINAGRCNGLDFKLLTDVCYGLNQFDATVSALLLPAADGFNLLPSRPPPELRCHGRLVTLVSHVAGTLVGLRHAEELDAMESLISFEPEAAEPGDAVQHTVDLDTCAGTAMLAHCDEAVLSAEYQALRTLQPTMFEVL